MRNVVENDSSVKTSGDDVDAETVARWRELALRPGRRRERPAAADQPRLEVEAPGWRLAGGSENLELPSKNNRLEQITGGLELFSEGHAPSRAPGAGSNYDSHLQQKSKLRRGNLQTYSLA
jgi:hypothetical protein